MQKANVTGVSTGTKVGDAWLEKNLKSFSLNFSIARAVFRTHQNLLCTGIQKTFVWSVAALTKLLASHAGPQTEGTVRRAFSCKCRKRAASRVHNNEGNSTGELLRYKRKAANCLMCTDVNTLPPRWIFLFLRELLMDNTWNARSGCAL